MGSAKEVGKLNQKMMSEAKGKLKNALGKAKQFGSNVSREVRELKNSARAFCRREVAKICEPIKKVKPLMDINQYLCEVIF